MQLLKQHVLYSMGPKCCYVCTGSAEEAARAGTGPLPPCSAKEAARAGASPLPPPGSAGEAACAGAGPLPPAVDKD